RGLDSFKVAHFADQDYVRILPQSSAQGFGKRSRVDIDFTLTHERKLVPVQELNWIFNGDDVARTSRINAIDHCGQRCRFAGSSRAGDQVQTASLFCDSSNHSRQAKCHGISALIGNHTKNDTDSAALLKDVRAKTTQAFDAVCDVD